jgi:hypothetical protein
MRDTVDVMIAEEAAAAAALTDVRTRDAMGRVVTSDADLLVLDPWRGVRILDPASYAGDPD